MSLRAKLVALNVLAAILVAAAVLGIYHDRDSWAYIVLGIVIAEVAEAIARLRRQEARGLE